MPGVRDRKAVATKGHDREVFGVMELLYAESGGGYMNLYMYSKSENCPLTN